VRVGIQLGVPLHDLLQLADDRFSHSRILIVVKDDPAAAAPAAAVEALNLIARQLELTVHERGVHRGTPQRELQPFQPAQNTSSDGDDMYSANSLRDGERLVSMKSTFFAAMASAKLRELRKERFQPATALLLGERPVLMNEPQCVININDGVSLLTHLATNSTPIATIGNIVVPWSAHVGRSRITS
jgi:hypothetical protein